MTTKTQIQVIPEPVGLISHDSWMKTRLVDIRQAIERFDAAGKAIPECWRSELANLEDEIEALGS